MRQFDAGLLCALLGFSLGYLACGVRVAWKLRQLLDFLMVEMNEHRRRESGHGNP